MTTRSEIKAKASTISKHLLGENGWLNDDVGETQAVDSYTYKQGLLSVNEPSKAIHVRPATSREAHKLSAITVANNPPNSPQGAETLAAISQRLSKLEKSQTEIQDDLRALMALSKTIIVQLTCITQNFTQTQGTTSEHLEMEYELESQLPEDPPIRGLDTQIWDAITSGYNADNY